MILRFAWRYFKGKKSSNAINLIAWVTTGVIAFATCCQVLVLSVFNGFEGLVKSLYASFYSDIKIVPSTGKTFQLSQDDIHNLRLQNSVAASSLIAEEKALLQNGDFQSVVILKGVDKNYKFVTGVSKKLIEGKFDLGTIDQPKIIMGYGVKDATGITMNEAFAPEIITVILPKSNLKANDPVESLSEGNVSTTGVFAIQQDFDNNYAITNIDFIKRQMGFAANEFSAAEIKLIPGADIETGKTALQKIISGNYIVQGRYEQNTNLYNTMQIEKWAIYAVLTLILIIAAFNMVSALTMLVLEKKKDISILQSMGSSKLTIQKIFLSEGLLLGIIGATAGILLAVGICLAQIKFQFIKLQGGSFLIDYFPVKLIPTDFLLVAGTAITIAFIASWFPAYKAARQGIE